MHEDKFDIEKTPHIKKIAEFMGKHGDDAKKCGITIAEAEEITEKLAKSNFPPSFKTRMKTR